MAKSVSMEELEAKIEEAVETAMNSEKFKAKALDIIKESAREVVYDAYDPTKYKRTYSLETDGAYIVSNSGNHMNITASVIHDSLIGDSPKDVVPVIVSGNGYELHPSFNGTLYQGAYETPRDFIEDAAGVMNSTNDLKKIIIAELKKKGFKAY